MKILLRIYFKPVWLSFFCGTYFNCFGSHSESEWGSKQHWNFPWTTLSLYGQNTPRKTKKE